MSNTFSRDPQPRIQYSGDGARTSFAFPFPVLASDDLTVFLDGNPASGYAINGLGEADGGEAVFAQPPASGSTITLLRRTEGIREAEFVDGGPFRASAINAELDRIMLLIQENREEHNRSLRSHPADGDADFCLPAAAQRANTVLAFDSAGRPTVIAPSELPDGGDASGLLVTPIGASTARILGEHLSTLVNVKDFGAKGDGVTDDSAAFDAAIAAAEDRRSPVFVPASPAPYLLGSGLVLNGVAMIGEGAGSILKTSVAAGFGLQLAGVSPMLRDLRLLGPAATAWPGSPAEVDLEGVALDGVAVALGASDAVLENVEIAGCHTALAVEGHLRAAVGSAFLFSRNGVEIRDGATGAGIMERIRFHACSKGLFADGVSAVRQFAVRGGIVSACGQAVHLPAVSNGWRCIELSDLRFVDTFDLAIRAGARNSLAVRSCHLDDSGNRSGTAIDLQASGQTIVAPNLTVENTRATATAVVPVELSGGTNLNLLQPGDLIVLVADDDDVDDLWTNLKATRGGLVHRVLGQTATSATIELARAASLPLIQATDIIRVVGRLGTAAVDSVGSAASATDFRWLRGENHCRVFSANNPMGLGQIELAGTSSDLRYLPGLGGEAVELSGVELKQGRVNGALMRLLTFTIAQDSAISFTPDSPIGMAHVFGHGSLGDPSGCVFTYRADALGYTQLVVKVDVDDDPDTNTIEVAQRTALTGTTGSAGVFTFSAHTDGKIYVENRMSSTPRTISLFLVGAPI
jgi:hypothetical protein